MKFTTVKSLLLALPLTFCSIAIAHAQVNELMVAPAVPPVAIGPYFTAGASASAGDVEQGTKTGMGFAFSAGATGVLPFDQNVGLTLGLGYESRGLSFRDQQDESKEFDYKCNYFTIRPEFKFKAFLLGIGVGIPVGISGTSVQTGSDLQSSQIPDQNTMIEVRAGGMIPLLESPTGILNLELDAAYPLTRIAAQSLSTTNLAPLATVDRNNGPIATFQLGLNYLFNLSEPGR